MSSGMVDWNRNASGTEGSPDRVSEAASYFLASSNLTSSTALSKASFFLTHLDHSLFLLNSILLTIQFTAIDDIAMSSFKIPLTPIKVDSDYWERSTWFIHLKYARLNATTQAPTEADQPSKTDHSKAKTTPSPPQLADDRQSNTSATSTTSEETQAKGTSSVSVPDRHNMALLLSCHNSSEAVVKWLLSQV